MQYTDVIATEIDPVYLEILRNAYLNTPGVDVREWDATLPPPADLPRGGVDPLFQCAGAHRG